MINITAIKAISLFLILPPTLLYYISKYFISKVSKGAIMKKTIIFIFTFLLSLTVLSCQEGRPENIPDYCVLKEGVDGVYDCSKEFYNFDTVIKATFYVDESLDEDLEVIFSDINDILIEYDILMSAYTEYEDVNNVYAINQSDGPIEIDQLLFDAIEFALVAQEDLQSGGELLFNIAYQPVTELWHDARYSERCESSLLYDSCPLPDQEALNASYNTNPDDIILNENDLTIDFSKNGMGIDLGGFAKGYISKVIEDYLSQYDLNYMINLGQSNILVHGTNIANPNADTYNIALTKPSFNFYDRSPYGYVIVESTYSVVTSGAYQRYFKNLEDDSDEQYYHHIIDPRTNYPGGEALALTIITNETAQSDILSTALFLMDYEDALAYVNDNEDLEAVWYFSEDDIRFSENFQDYFRYLN
jgi:thiamine biosynthesis lipoprotein